MSTEFHNEIKKTFRGNIPSVQGRYFNFKNLTDKGVKTVDNSNDASNFKKLFLVAPDKNTGNGEVALFWLFNYKNYDGKFPPTKNQRAKHLGGAEADLMIDGIPIEVKAYPKSLDTASKLGKFLGADPNQKELPKNEKKKREFVNLVKLLFLIDNLLYRETGSMRDIQSFEYYKLRDAADSMCRIRKVLLDDPKIKKLPFFDKISGKIDDIDKMFNNLGLKECTYDKNYSPGDRAGGEKIATQMIRLIIKLVTDGKPGPGGFVVNMKKNDPTSIEYKKISNKIDNKAIQAESGSGTTRQVYFSEGNLFLAYNKVFK